MTGSTDERLELPLFVTRDVDFKDFDEDFLIGSCGLSSTGGVERPCESIADMVDFSDEK